MALQYATRRYGAWSPSAQAAWQLLLDGAYTQANMDTSVFTQVPTVGISSSHWTNATAITGAWRLLVQAASNGEVGTAASRKGWRCISVVAPQCICVGDR